jgi:hypothetical protein
MATLTSPGIDELLTNVRMVLGQTNASNSTWTDEELIEYLNKGIRRYFIEIVQTGEGQFTTTSDLDLVASTETVALPSDFFKIKNVWKRVSGGYQILNYRNSLSEGYSTTGSSTGDSYRPNYYLRGNNLVLRPVPSSSETDGLRIEYVQFPETMLTGGDSLTAQVSPVFKDLIEAYAVYMAKLKESMTNGSSLYGPAQEHLNAKFASFREVMSEIVMNPTYVEPFNPEE